VESEKYRHGPENKNDCAGEGHQQFNRGGLQVISSPLELIVYSNCKIIFIILNLKLHYVSEARPASVVRYTKRKDSTQLGPSDRTRIDRWA
jgi:hypothetical protein